VKGCLLRLALLPVITAVVYVLLSLRAPWPTFVFPAESAEVAAIPAGFFLWFAVLFYLDARRADAEYRLAVHDPEQGVRDGERVSVWGTIEAVGPLLTAPFSGEPCVGYCYLVSHTATSGNRMSPQTDYEGYAFTPSAITGSLGSLRILAPAGAEVFHEVRSSELDDEAYERAAAFLAATDFGPPPKHWGQVSRKSTEGAPGEGFRMDMSAGAPKDLRKCDLGEQVLKVGDEVHVAGVFVEEGRGIAPDPDSIMRPFHLTPGGARALRRKARNRRIGAVVCLALALLMAAVYLLVYVPGTP
jgi:hypothetical protein